MLINNTKISTKPEPTLDKYQEIQVFVFFLSLLASCYALWGYFTGRTLPGWLSIVVPFYLLGGLQILCLGILGEYLGKIYKETKRRPRYIVEETRGFEQIRDMTGTGDW